MTGHDTRQKNDRTRYKTEECQDMIQDRRMTGHDTIQKNDRIQDRIMTGHDTRQKNDRTRYKTEDTNSQDMPAE